MALTVATILDRARQIAKCQQYVAQSVDALNAQLTSYSESYDLAIARGLYTFDFDPTLQSAAFGAQFVGSGPYNLPVDFIRASGSSGDGQKTYIWYLQGVPYPMIPIDLAEFDMQVKQAGLQSYPYFMATDMSNAGTLSSRYRSMQPVGTTEGSTTIVPTAMTVTGSSAPALVAGDGIAGEAIVPGTTIVSVGATDAVISQAATATFGAGLVGASVLIGTMPQFYVYPPPSGAYPVTVRYQRMMPPVWDVTRFPWFPDDDVLIEGVAGRLMEITDDSRAAEFIGDGARLGRADRRLRHFLSQVDDKTNRPQTVELDRRRFGPKFNALPHTKTVGW